MFRATLRRAGIAAALTAALGHSAWAANYYVSPSGHDLNPGTLAAPWRTIDRANLVVRAGDTVYMRGGEYVDDPISPSRSGTASQPISYVAYGAETPILTSYNVLGMEIAIDLDSVSHIIIEGILVTGRAGNPSATIKHFAVLDDCSYVQVRNSTFQFAHGYNGFTLTGGSHHNRVVGNRFDFVGKYDDDGNDFGDGINIAGSAYQNIFASNVVTHAPHSLIRVTGKRNLILNNVFDNDWSDVIGSGKGGRNLTLRGERNVFEGNIVRNAAASIDNPRNPGMKVEGIGNIVRRNVIVSNHHDAIISETGSWSPVLRDNHIFHNTIYNNGGAAWKIDVFSSGGTPERNVFLNNVVYQNRQDSSAADADIRLKLEDAGIDGPGSNLVVNNLITKSSDGDSRVILAMGSMDMDEAEDRFPKNFISNIQRSPTFVRSNPTEIADFALKSGSPGIDDGVPLTETKSAGSGRTVSVRDAGYFSDGFGLLPGDLVRIGGFATAQIVDVDYGSDTIELDRSLSWGDGDPVTLEFAGIGPDIGAVENDLSVSASRPRAPTLAIR